MTTLDELRRANLLEQRRKMEAAEAEKPADKTVEPAKAAPAPTPPPAASTATAPSTQPAASAKREPAATPLEVPVAHANGNGYAQTAPSASEPAIAEEPEAPVAAVDDAERKARAILDRFYRGLAHKVVYPTGVKATVDMPPELFWRVKRYCHDHNNVTVRQLFLDLVIALLDEEGY